MSSHVISFIFLHRLSTKTAVLSLHRSPALYSSSNPWSVNRSVRQFSVTVLTVPSGTSPVNSGGDFQRNLHIRTNQRIQMLQHFTGNQITVARQPEGLCFKGSMESPIFFFFGVGTITR